MLPTMFQFIWPSGFRGEDFQKLTNSNDNCLRWPCLLTDLDDIINLYRGPSIDASYQVSVHFAEGFQRRRLKCEKLTDDRRRTPSDGKSSHCLWQGEIKKMGVGISPTDLSRQRVVMTLKENSSQLNNCDNSIHCNFLFVNN